MKKTFSLIMLAIMMAAGAMAQKMVVKTTDQQMVMFDIPNVESVSFVDGYVDLGLPSGTLWATCNVGASSPEEYGDFFAWGETEPKSEYAWTNYFDYDADDASNRYKKYNNDGGLTELLPEDDAAAANWGEGWQMPSKEQFEELIDPNYTTTVWTEQNGVYGRMIIGKNSNSIFLPAAGFCWGMSHNTAGSDGYYWSRTLNASSGLAEDLCFGSSGISGLSSGRGMGFSVRPVVCGAKQTQKIPVTGIVLNYSTLSLLPDATLQLTATVEPEDASNKAVTWKSSDASVATVNTDGLVTAKAEGTCTITCSAKDGSGVKSECQVTVAVQKIPVTEIKLSAYSKTLPVGDTFTLTATVLPEDASIKTVTWTTTDANVATVSNGLVTAKGPGICKITCRATDGSNEFRNCQVIVVEIIEEGSLCPDDHHPHTIDLGLPSGTKWCCCNVGASTPDAYGGYYAWGETSEKSSYDRETYQHCYFIEKDRWGYIDIGDDIAGTDYDAATVNMGASWRMPSKEQIEELINNTSRLWVQVNGVNGALVTGQNGGQIFLPATGYRADDELRQPGSYGSYWSSTQSKFFGTGAMSLDINAEYSSILWMDDLGQSQRYFGKSVRPVRKQ